MVCTGREKKDPFHRLILFLEVWIQSITCFYISEGFLFFFFFFVVEQILHFTWIMKKMNVIVFPAEKSRYDITDAV